MRNRFSGRTSPSTSSSSDADVLAAAIGAVQLAPSIHNTRPWRWTVDADDLVLRPDRDRQLRVSDPLGRLLVLSCGASLYYARVAIAAHGREPIVDRLSGPRDPDVLARIRLGCATAVEPALTEEFQAAMTRRTDRRPPASRTVADETFALLRTAAETEDTRLYRLWDDDVVLLAVANRHAEDIAAGNESLRAEQARWEGELRFAGPGDRDGAAPYAGTYLMPPRFTAPEAAAPRFGADRSATYAVLAADEDTPSAWLRGGEALSRTWLAAVTAGLAVVPFSAVVETDATRQMLRGLMSFAGHPLLVLRIGYVDGTADPASPGDDPFTD